MTKPPDKPGLYWVRFEYTPSYLPKWSVSSWDGARWTNIGHEDSWTPEDSSIVDWSGPLVPPGEFSVGKPFVVQVGDEPVAIAMDRDGNVRDLWPEMKLRAAVRDAEAAVRFLWDAWSEAEGSGQPEGYVFGDENEGSIYRRPSAEVQAVIRGVLERVAPFKVYKG
jgi:hypothetical protein